jgi:7,8-dihydroneopterin aldolase/epimerase/oxygenase
VSERDRIDLRGVRAVGHHGVYPLEREHGQPFVVDVTLYLDLAPAGHSDEVSDTVHYGELAGAVEAVIAGEPVALIETLAQRVADTCLGYALVESVDVTVHKPEAPVPVTFSDVAVTIHRRRS